MTYFISKNIVAMLHNIVTAATILSRKSNEYAKMG